MTRLRAAHTRRFLALGLFALTGACHPGSRPPRAAVAVTPTQLATAFARYTAQNCEVEINAKSIDNLSAVLVSAPLLDNKPVHDCQKLATDYDNYGPLAAVLVGDSLDARIARAATGVVLADVINYSPVPYARLGIIAAPAGGAQLHCLWVKGPPDNPAKWIVGIRVARGRTCVMPDTLGPITDTLQVDTLNYSQHGNAHPTARWGWDDTTSVHFLGIHCGAAWCEFGPPGFKRNAVMPADMIGRADEQYLDVPVTGGASHPSHLRGRIRPFAALDSRDTTAFENDTTHVAAIILSGNAGDANVSNAHANYRSKLKLTADSTDLIMRYLPGGRWQVSLSTRPGVWTDLHRGNSTHAGAGAVRWFWDPKDAGVWLSCTDGCCSTSSVN